MYHIVGHLQKEKTPFPLQNDFVELEFNVICLAQFKNVYNESPRLVG